MKKIAIYCRVSTEEQKKTGISLHDQHQRGIEFCQKHNYSYEIFEDGGISGEDPIEKRPALNELIERILSKFMVLDNEEINEFYGIYVIALDRLSRNTKVSRFIKETLVENKVKLFVSDGTETNFEDPNDNLMFEFKSLLDEYENKKTRVRIKNALKRNAIDGKVGGGKLINYGYTKDKEKKLVVEPTQSKVIRQIFQLCLDGKGTKVIANILNENKIPTKRGIINAPMKVKGKTKDEFKWRDSVVYRILKNPIYKGERIFKGESYICPKIIDDNIFDSVQDILSKRKNSKNTTNKYFYLLKGLIYCGKCGSRMYGRKRADLSDNQYICSSQRFKGEFCGNRGINIDKIEDIIVNSVINLPKEYKAYIKKVHHTQHIEGQLKVLNLFKVLKAEVEEKITNLLELYSTNLSDKTQLVNMVNEKNQEIKDLEEKIIEIENKIQGKSLEKKLLSLIEKTSFELKKNIKDSHTRKNIITGVIDKIDVDWLNDDKPYHYIRIIYNFNYKTGVKITKSVDVNYKKSGFSYRFKELKNDVIIEVNSPNRRHIGTSLENEGTTILKGTIKKKND